MATWTIASVLRLTNFPASALDRLVASVRVFGFIWHWPDLLNEAAASCPPLLASAGFRAAHDDVLEHKFRNYFPLLTLL
jgi:hypothetical protein